MPITGIPARTAAANVSLAAVAFPGWAGSPGPFEQNKASISYCSESVENCVSGGHQTTSKCSHKFRKILYLMPQSNAPRRGKGRSKSSRAPGFNTTGSLIETSSTRSSKSGEPSTLRRALSMASSSTGPNTQSTVPSSRTRLVIERVSMFSIPGTPWERSNSSTVPIEKR